MSDQEEGRVRLDKWLWAARFFKTRALAAEAVEGGKVEVNGDRPKRARPIQIGDEIRIRLGPYEHTVAVRALSGRRGPAPEAAGLYQETEASRTKREELSIQLKSLQAVFGPDKGPPSKKDRRDIQRLKGRR
jgi:ribosome-associated heat shock protein Hsp15